MDSRRDSMSSFEHVELAQAANVSHDDTPLAGSAVFEGPSPSPPPDRNETAAQPSGEEPQAPDHTRGTGQDPLKEIEEVAELVVDTAVLAARDVTQLATEAAKEARQGFNSLATGLSSWWSSFDAPTQNPSSNVDSEDADAVALAVQLELEPGEALLESFACTLLQHYVAANALTPDRELPFPGHLHVTSKHAVFVASDSSLSPVRFAIASLTSACRQGQGRVSEQRLVLSPAGTGKAVFTGFQDAGPESALALLEHLGSPEDSPVTA